MFARLIIAPLGVLGLLALSGCGPGKLDETKNWTLEPGETKSLDLDAQPKSQTITVEFDSTAAEVNVGVFKSTDAKELESVVYSKAIKAETGKKTGSVSADVPENTAVRVVAGGAKKKTEVKLHVTNRK